MSGGDVEGDCCSCAFALPVGHSALGREDTHIVRVGRDLAPMEGQGGYNRRSAVQVSGAAPALAMLEQAAHEIALPDGDATIVVADYGSSAGRNSLAPMARAIGVRRARIGPERAVAMAIQAPWRA